MLTIFRSPFVFVNESTSVSQCIRQMNVFKVGSVLVLSDRNPRKLTGIMTERDIIMNFDSISTAGGGALSVRTFMTKNVITIPAEELKKANQIIIKHQIRHLPITSSYSTGDTSVIGVISMRDLFQAQVRGKTLPVFLINSEIKVENLPQATVGVVSNDRSFLTQIKFSFSISPQIKVKLIPIDKLSTDKGRPGMLDVIDILVLDIEGNQGTSWVELLKLINFQTKPLNVIIVLDPLRHSDDMIQKLEEIGKKSDKFILFWKPINIFSLFQAVGSRLKS